MIRNSVNSNLNFHCSDNVALHTAILIVVVFCTNVTYLETFSRTNNMEE